MRSLVKEEPDWRTGIMAGDRVGVVGGPLRLRRGSRFTWRKECQSIMERWASRTVCLICKGNISVQFVFLKCLHKNLTRVTKLCRKP